MVARGLGSNRAYSRLARRPVRSLTLFFFVVGLELKREILVGELTSIRQAALPIVAASEVVRAWRGEMSPVRSASSLPRSRRRKESPILRIWRKRSRTVR